MQLCSNCGLPRQIIEEVCVECGEKFSAQSPPFVEQNTSPAQAAKPGTISPSSPAAVDGAAPGIVRQWLLREWNKYSKIAGIFLIITLLGTAIHLFQKWTTEPPTVKMIACFPLEIPINGKVKLIPTFSNPDGYSPKPEWHTTAGIITIAADGISAILDVSGFQPTHTPFQITISLTLVDTFQRSSLTYKDNFYIVPRENNPPRLKTISTEPDPATVQVGEQVKLRADVEDPDKDGLHYQWSVKNGRVDQVDSAETTLYTSGIEMRSSFETVDVTLIVTDGHEGSRAFGHQPVTVTREAKISGQQQQRLVIRSNKSNAAPIMFAFQPIRSVIHAGERVDINALMSEPSNNLSYKWATSNGRLEINGPNATLDTSGINIASESISIVVALTVTDEQKGGSVSGRVVITVLSLGSSNPPQIELLPSPVVVPHPEPSTATKPRVESPSIISPNSNSSSAPP